MNQVETDIEERADLEEDAGGVAVDSGSEATEGRTSLSGAEEEIDFGQRIADAKTSEDLDALIDDLPEPGEKIVDDDSAEEAKGADEGLGDDSGEEDESDEEDSEEADEDSADDSGEDAAEEDDSQDEEEEEDAPKSKRFRLRTTDQAEQEALSLKKRNPDMSLEECLAKAKQKLGIADASEDGGADGDEYGGEEDPDLEAMQAEADQLWEDYDKAVEELDEDKAKELKKQARAKEREVVEAAAEAKFKREDRKRRMEEDFCRKLEESAVKAVDLYPWLDDPDDAANQRFDEVLAIYKETGNPILNTPDFALKIAHQVATEYGRLPRGKKAPIRKKKPAKAEADTEKSNSSSAPGKRQKAPIANGKRSSAGSANKTQGDLTQRISGAKTSEEVERLAAELGLGRTVL